MFVCIWYDYGNVLVEWMIWFDGLDILLVVVFDVGFVEGCGGGFVYVFMCFVGDSLVCYGVNMWLLCCLDEVFGL